MAHSLAGSNDSFRTDRPIAILLLNPLTQFEECQSRILELFNGVKMQHRISKVSKWILEWISFGPVYSRLLLGSCLGLCLSAYEIKIERYTIMKQITAKQYAKIRALLPVQRGKVQIPNIVFINAFLYVMENGCKWRSLPERFGKWYTVYARCHRWSQSGVLARLFPALRTRQHQRQGASRRHRGAEHWRIPSTGCL